MKRIISNSHYASTLFALTLLIFLSNSLFAVVDPATRTLNTSTAAVGSTAGSLDVSPSGAATYNIPIIVPPGIGGMQPSLAIVYNSQGGNGLLGYGWNLSGISAITRTGQNKFYDGPSTEIKLTTQDRFLLDGQRIVNTGPYTYGKINTAHGLEINDFSTITPMGTAGTGPAYFVVEKKDGTKMYYGNYSGGGSNAYLKSSSNATIIAWYLCRVEDKRGNFMTYHYTKDEANGETYLYRISYTGNTADSPAVLRYEVSFTYTTRNDINVGYIAGCKVTQSKLISKIRTGTSTSLRSYEPVYYFDEVTKLNEIKEYGATGSENYNSIVVGYGAKAEKIYLNNRIKFVFNDNELMTYQGLCDFNGDGKTDILKCNRTSDLTKKEYYWELWLKSGPTFIKAQTGDVIFKNVNSFTFLPGDYDKDGLMDMIVAVDMGATDKAFCFKSNGSTLSIDQTKAIDIPDVSNVYPGDFDGDTKTEFIALDITGNTIRYFTYNNGLLQLPQQTNIPFSFYKLMKKFYVGNFNGDNKDDIICVSSNNLRAYNISPSGFSIFFSSNLLNTQKFSNYYLYDYNGDGYLDGLVWGSTNGWKLFLNTGFNFIEATAPSLPNKDMELSLSDNNLLITDYNNDGMSDILYCHMNGESSILEFYFSTGIGFNKTVVTGSEFPPIINSFRSFIDFNGDGNSDIYCRAIQGGFPYFYLINSEDRSRFVSTIAHGTNVLSKLSFRTISCPINGVYTKGTGAVHPLMDYQGPLYVVTALIEAVGDQTITNNSYSYKGARIHKLGKGFLGFKEFKVQDNLTSYSTTKAFTLGTKYHVYPSGVYVRYGTTIVSSKNISMLYTTYSYGGQIFPYVSQSTEYNSLDDTKVTTFNNTYDAYGNPTKITTTYISDNNATQGHGTVDATKTNEYTYWKGSKIPFLPATIKTTTSRTGQTSNIRNTSITYTSKYLPATIIADAGTAYEVREVNTYDVSGNITEKKLTDKNSTQLRKTTFTYDANRRFMRTTTNALGHSVTYTYDQRTGNVLTSKNAQGITTTYTYDLFGRLLTTTTPEGTSSISYSWSNDANIANDRYFIKKTNIDGSFVKEYYDAFGRVVQNRTSGFNGAEILTTTTYNTKGQVATTTEPYYSTETPKSITYSYDVYGRLTSTSSYRQKTTYSYPEVRKTVVTNGLSTTRTSWKKVNSLGEVVQAHDNGGDLKYTYNAIGKPVKIEAPGGIITTMEYDLLGRQTKLVDPNAGTITYTYDLLGQIKTQTDPKATNTMTYDALGRLTSQANITEGTNTYTYVASGNGLGLLQSVTNSKTNISHSYVYNANAWVTSETEKINGTNYSYSYAYDTKGRVSQLTYPGSFSIKNVYGSYGELRKVTDASGAKIWELTSVSSHGEIKQMTYGNGLTTNWTYDTYHQPSLIITTTSASVNRQYLQYGFDHKTGNLYYRRDVLANNGSSVKENFTYDNLDRLTSYKAGSNAAYTISYKTDGSGRFVSKSDLGPYTYGGANNTVPHAPTSITGTDGNAIDRNQQDITYTPFQKVQSISHSWGGITFTYGPEQTRKYTITGAQGYVKKKTYAGSLYELEEDQSGNKRHLYYIPGPNGEAAIYVKTNSGTPTPYYIHKDYQGSYQTITNSSGAIVETLSFDPWGRRRNPVNWSYTGTIKYTFDRGYTGHEHLDAFGLINMNGRVYDPYTAHFLSPDNYVQAPGFTQSYNRYSYCLNNPLKFVDPSGYLSRLKPRQYMHDGGSMGGCPEFAHWGGFTPVADITPNHTKFDIPYEYYKFYSGEDALTVGALLLLGLNPFTGEMPTYTYSIEFQPNSKLITNGYRAPIGTLPGNLPPSMPIKARLEDASGGGAKTLDRLGNAAEVADYGVGLAEIGGYNASLGIGTGAGKKMLYYFSSGWNGRNQYVLKTFSVTKGTSTFLWGANTTIEYLKYSHGQPGLETSLNIGASTTSLIVAAKVGTPAGIATSAGYEYLKYMWNNIIDYGNAVHQLYRDTYQQYFQGTPYEIPGQ